MTSTNTNRSTVDRLLQRHMSVPKSKTLRRKVFDDWTRGWKLHWTTSDYAYPYVGWENGSLAHLRNTRNEERHILRDECLDEAVVVLTAAGYVVKRETGSVLILDRTDAPAHAVGDQVTVARDMADRFRPNAPVYLRAGCTGTVRTVFRDQHRKIWRYLVTIGVSDYYLDQDDVVAASTGCRGA